MGRFQPFHNGHAYLVEQGLARFEKVTIAVGSAQDEWTVDNPFSFAERRDMIQKWVDENGLSTVHSSCEEPIAMVTISKRASACSTRYA